MHQNPTETDEHSTRGAVYYVSGTAKENCARRQDLRPNRRRGMPMLPLETQLIHKTVISSKNGLRMMLRAESSTRSPARYICKNRVADAQWQGDLSALAKRRIIRHILHLAPRLAQHRAQEIDPTTQGLQLAVSLGQPPKEIKAQQHPLAMRGNAPLAIPLTQGNQWSPRYCNRG